MPATIEQTVSRDNRKRAQQIMEKLPNPLFLADPAGKVLLSNPATPISIGVSLDEFLATNVRECVDKGYYDVSVACEATRKKQHVSRILTTRLGVVVVANGTPILDASGEVQFTVINGIPIKDYEKSVDKQDGDPERHQRHMQGLFGGLIKDNSIVAESRTMREVLIKAASVADCDSAVMISGETGTGKDVVARFIHNRSRRAHKPFIPVNAAALPEALAEAELFGYERGAFTGARPDGYEGLFAAAEGGTLFLDEVADFSPALQAKLLRVLDTGEYRRLGSVAMRKTDVRIIAATHKELDELVRAGQFRRDLFFRLNVLPISIPPLRERPEDVIALAEKFRRDICGKIDCNIEIDPATLAAFIHRDWSGNARELRGHVERYVLDARSSRAPALWKEASGPAGGALDILHLFEIGGPLKDVLNQVEENYVKYMLTVCGGRVGVTASKLGLYRNALYRKLKFYRERESRSS
jgi:transcriptional regulator with PAS, ATPase and Fis domain